MAVLCHSKKHVHKEQHFIDLADTLTLNGLDRTTDRSFHVLILILNLFRQGSNLELKLKTIQNDNNKNNKKQ